VSVRSPYRLLLALGAALGLLFLLLLAILLTDTLVNIWHNLREASPWLQGLVATALGLFALFSAWVVWRLLRPPSRLSPQERREPPSREELERQLEQARDADIEIESHVLGGTTREVREYHWHSPAGDELVLLDMPGLDEVGGELDPVAREEALRAHIVIYVVDGDLTRSQARELEQLLQLGKPTVVALNKVDRLRPEELELVVSRLQERVNRLGSAEVVPVSTGATVPATRMLPGGTEEEVQHRLPPQVDRLKEALQRIIDSHSETLGELRDSTVFVLVQHHLDQALQQHRREEARRLVSGYSKKAIAGAVAAMTPGTDLLIQGFLATRMVKELAALYDVPVRKVDVELLLELIQRHVKTHITLLLAVAGNACKAFPGSGTLAGGALHAVAYGMLFDALGKSLAASLESRGELHPLQVADKFEEQLGEEVKGSAARYARLVFDQLRKRGD